MMRNHLFHAMLTFMGFLNHHTRHPDTGMFNVHFPTEIDQAFQNCKTHFQIQATQPVPRQTLSIPLSCFIFTCLLVSLPPEIQIATFTWYFLCTHHSSKKSVDMDSCNKTTSFYRKARCKKWSNLPEVPYLAIGELAFEARQSGWRVCVLWTLLYYPWEHKV